jgi:YidC/Oxa1 family membrane protein insertase
LKRDPPLMEKRVLLAIFLAFATLYLWQALFVPAPTKPGETGGPSGPPAQTQAVPPEPIGAAAPAGAPSAPIAPPSSTPVLSDAGERDVRLETDRVIAVFTNRGARLKSWRLKKYHDQSGEPVELVAVDVPNQPLPFSLRADNDATTATLNGALYAVRDTSPNQVAFEYRDTAGLHAVKEFQIEPASYVVNVRVAVDESGSALAPAIDWGPGLGDNDPGSGSYAVKAGGIYSVGDEEDRVTAADAGKQPSRQGDFQFAGIEDHYFLAAAVFPGSATVRFRPVATPPPPGSEQPARELMAYTIEPGPRTDPIKFYVGPKDFDELAAVDRSLVRAINFGMFAIIVVPLLRALNWVNGFVGNYGWSIILLTIFINALMFPLRHKSVVSMRKMAEIQPEAKAIQDRYKNLKATDPAKQKMNQEMMALYRERGVNPASGCVPMLLTLPVLLAFYAMLTTAIELRGAPFVGWIHDLSRHDPLYITPVLMGITQIWQQRITPQTGVDPAQQKMMMFMPVLFMVFFLWAPAGVAIYWFVSNIWGIGQQYLTNYLIGPPNVRPPARSAAERRLKRAGAGRTDAAAADKGKTTLQ